MRRNIAILSFIVSMVVFASCGGNAIRHKLDDIESYIQARPDSALAAIRAIDTNALSSPSLKAQYSLLHAMALDKNYIDTTNLSVIMPAIEYYEKSGDAVHRMRAWYYHGRILQNAGNSQEAMYSFSKALDESKETEDYFYKGLINSIMAVLYATQYSCDEALKYSKEAYSCFMKTTDTLGQWIHQGQLAVSYGNNREKEKSDSVFKEYLSRPVLDTLVFAKNLFAYAKMVLAREPSDPERCIEIFDKARKEYGGKPRLRDYYFYAAALEKVGNSEASDRILSKIVTLDSLSYHSYYWRYVIYRQRHDYEKALRYLRESVHAQDSVIINNLHQSLEKSRKEYYIEKSNYSEERRRNTILKSSLIISLLIVISLVVILYLYSLRKRQEIRIVELQKVKEDLVEQLKESNDAKNELDKRVIEIRKNFYCQHKEKFGLLDRLFTAYYLATYKERKDRIYEQVEEVVSKLNANNGSKTGIEDLANKYLDNIIENLRQDVPRQKPETYQLFSYLVAGISPKSISMIMNISVPAVYTRIHRLKGAILKTESKNQEKYMYFF